MVEQWLELGLALLPILFFGALVVKKLFFTSIEDLRKQTQAFLQEENQEKRPRQF